MIGELSEAKVPVVTREDYCIMFEEVRGHRFVHCDIYKWNKKVRNKLLQDAYSLLREQDRPILAIHDAGDDKHLKFLTMMGFVFTDHILKTNKGDKMVFIWKDVE